MFLCRFMSGQAVVPSYVDIEKEIESGLSRHYAGILGKQFDVFDLERRFRLLAWAAIPKRIRLIVKTPLNIIELALLRSQALRFAHLHLLLYLG